MAANENDTFRIRLVDENGRKQRIPAIRLERRMYDLVGHSA